MGVGAVHGVQPGDAAQVAPVGECGEAMVNTVDLGVDETAVCGGVEVGRVDLLQLVLLEQ